MSTASSSCGARSRRHRRLANDGAGDAVHRAADQAQAALSRPVDGAGQDIARSSSTSPTASCRRSRTALKLGYCRRFEQELQGLLQVDPERRARGQARAGPLHVGRGSDDAARRQRPAGSGAGLAARASPMSSATPITSSTACRSASGGGAGGLRVAAHPDPLRAAAGRPAGAAQGDRRHDWRWAR